MVRLEIETPLGSMLLAAGAEALCGAWFLGQRHFPRAAGEWKVSRSALLSSAEEQIQAYLEGELASFSLPLAWHGTAFQKAVWSQLLDIPYGGIQSYGQIANALDQPAASRAVGAAVGRNPLSLIVPCHRVIGADGKLTGYAGGLERKRKLLALEAKVASAVRPVKTV
ncbi:MAG: methylated-DNA--[protein]-cysteine S-methyltransferase [Wenzhouxiangella sp.]|jgi:methylated-DNA-[protein]-cysteine S-methyltransferase|nr:methylated-DNA--[protein]-cysteine S-methyltransferase [Wenzhouxiangella sp.]